MKKTNVLIFPASGENALEMFDALHEHMDIEVFGLCGKPDYAAFLYPEDRYLEGRFYITDADFIQRFNTILSQWKIDVVIPSHDEIALFFSKNRNFINAKILISPYETALICREKKRMYQVISDCSFAPKVWHSSAEVRDEDYPIFVKPNIGAGAQGAEIVYSQCQLLNILEKDQSMVLCEYLPGEECTVDCYTNKDGVLLFAGARTRDRIQNGIAVRSTTFHMTPEIMDVCETINSRIAFFGAWYLQLKKNHDGIWKLLEISCRQAGGMTLYRHKGINFPMLGIYELNGIPVSAQELPGTWMFERRLSARYQIPYQFDHVYVDLDDTLIVKGKVNTTLMAFLYQCVNDGKKLYLLTRHARQPVETLNFYRINLLLFDEIIHITFEQKKSDSIKYNNAILIDNSFAERAQVYQTLQIPVFDVDAVDCLLNCRIKF